MSRKKMNKLADMLEAMYLTENPINIGDNYGYRYFLCFHNTHTIYARTKSIQDMIFEIEYILENGIGIN